MKKYLLTLSAILAVSSAMPVLASNVFEAEPAIKQLSAAYPAANFFEGIPLKEDHVDIVVTGYAGGENKQAWLIGSVVNLGPCSRTGISLGSKICIHPDRWEARWSHNLERPGAGIGYFRVYHKYRNHDYGIIGFPAELKLTAEEQATKEKFASESAARAKAKADKEKQNQGFKAEPKPNPQPQYNWGGYQQPKQPEAKPQPQPQPQYNWGGYQQPKQPEAKPQPQPQYNWGGYQQPKQPEAKPQPQPQPQPKPQPQYNWGGYQQPKQPEYKYEMPKPYAPAQRIATGWYSLDEALRNLAPHLTKAEINAIPKGTNPAILADVYYSWLMKMDNGWQPNYQAFQMDMPTAALFYYAKWVLKNPNKTRFVFDQTPCYADYYFDAAQYLLNYPHVREEAARDLVDPEVYASLHYMHYKDKFHDLTYKKKK